MMVLMMNPPNHKGLARSSPKNAIIHGRDQGGDANGVAGECEGAR